MGWHNYFATFPVKQFCMNREDEKKKPDTEQGTQTAAVADANSRNIDDDEASYPGKLDKVEGQMNNGEIGGGIKKEEE